MRSSFAKSLVVIPAEDVAEISYSMAVRLRNGRLTQRPIPQFVILAEGVAGVSQSVLCACERLASA